jgi:putative transposase
VASCGRSAQTQDPQARRPDGRGRDRRTGLHELPPQHRAKLHSTNPIERPIGEIKRRTEVIGIFPNEADITRLVGAILLEQNDEWAVQRARYITLESIAPVSDDPLVGLPAAAA